jgi:hypothetical protein
MWLIYHPEQALYEDNSRSSSNQEGEDDEEDNVETSRTISLTSEIEFCFQGLEDSLSFTSISHTYLSQRSMVMSLHMSSYY